MRMGLTALALLSLATVAQAGIVLNNLGPAVRSGGTPDTLPGYNAWQVVYTIDNTAYDITAVDFWTPAITSGTFQHVAFGIFAPAGGAGKLAQRWSWDVNANGGDGGWVGTPTNSAVGGTTPITGSAFLDSHFVTSGTFDTSTSPIEDEIEPSSLPDGILSHADTASFNYGYGTFLRQLNTTAASKSVVLAYLVIPDNLVADPNGTEVFGRGQIATTDPVAFGKKDATFGFALVPEPGSLSLLALGGLAMLRRRR